MFKVIVAGGRDFNDFQYLCKRLDHLLQHKISNVEIVSGHARGADKLGERYAQLRNIPVKIIPANWDKYGKSAGYRRNEEMADYADALVAFWDGQSRGTKHMIDCSKDKGLLVRIQRY